MKIYEKVCLRKLNFSQYFICAKKPLPPTQAKYSFEILLKIYLSKLQEQTSHYDSAPMTFFFFLIVFILTIFCDMFCILRLRYWQFCPFCHLPIDSFQRRRPRQPKIVFGNTFSNSRFFWQKFVTKCTQTW